MLHSKKTFLLLVFFFFSLVSAKEHIIYIYPGSFGNLFDLHPKIGNGQITMYKLKQILQQNGYQIQQVDSFKNLQDAYCIVSFDVPIGFVDQLQQYPEIEKVLFLWEPPTVKPYNYNRALHKQFSRVYTWNDLLVDNQKYFKFFYPQPDFFSAKNLPDFADRKLCTLVACNKSSQQSCELYSERIKVIEFFEKLPAEDFDFYGMGWPMGRYKNYRGCASSKKDLLRNYRFCICYENTKDIPGYITEKIFDCFVAGCIPVYWGANNIEQYIPATCFINRRNFNNNEQLYSFLKTMTQETYNQYLNSVRAFLEDQQAYIFSSDYFIELFMDIFTIHVKNF